MYNAQYILLFLLLSNFVISDQSELLSVVVLFRHGSRSPRFLYKNDPYKEKASIIWPEGLGQLTNVGKSEAYNLGLWYRKKYKNFIPNKYNPNFIRILSSNKDRCLMSAACNLAGLFPPQKEQIWNTNIAWQPIPIHTTPEIYDQIIINDDVPCKKYERLFNELVNSEESRKFLESQREVLEYLSNHTGDNIKTPRDLVSLHDALFIESYYNLTLPEWSHKVFPHDTFPLMTLTYAWETNTTDLSRLKTGVLVDYITIFFEDYFKNPEESQKMLMLSSHDSTIARLMNTLGIYDYTWAEYASTLGFELRKTDEKVFIRIYWRDTKKFKILKLPMCSSDCKFDKFKNITKPVRINTDERENECLN